MTFSFLQISPIDVAESWSDGRLNLKSSLDHSAFVFLKSTRRFLRIANVAGRPVRQFCVSIILRLNYFFASHLKNCFTVKIFSPSLKLFFTTNNTLSKCCVMANIFRQIKYFLFLKSLTLCNSFRVLIFEN